MPVTVRRTACNRDCPDACSLLVHVDEAGRAIRLKGDPEDPVTRGFLCERTTRFLDRQYSADRFTAPLYRGRPIGWDEALDLAAERLLHFRDGHGPQSILHYRSGGSLGMLKLTADLLFEKFGPVSGKRGDICSGAGEAAQELDFGLCDSHDLHDLRHSRLILIWGKNAHTSGVHLVPCLREARSRGSVLVGVDVVRTRTMDLCDVFVPIRPGGDFALAMGVARRLFETGHTLPPWCDGAEGYRALVHSKTLERWAADAGVEAEDVHNLAELYGSIRPGALLVGWGLTRRTGGGAAVRALDALGALTGNLGVSGGGVSFYYKRRGAFDTSFLQGRHARTFPEATLGEAVSQADPPVRMIWVTAGNPVSMLPDSLAVQGAFDKAEFVVVVDTHPTDTTDAADLVLPTLTLLEDDDVLGAYGNHYLRASSPAVEPPGEARHELRILQGLAQRLGLADVLAGTPADWKRRMLPEVSLEALAQGAVRNPHARKVLFEGGVFPTPTGRMNLVTEAPPSPDRHPEFPLTLLAVSSPRTQGSQWAVPVEGPAQARVHPALGFQDGQEAYVETPLGRLDVRIVPDARVHPEAVLMEKGGMLRQGRGVNALLRARETDLGGGADFYDQPARLVT